MTQGRDYGKKETYFLFYNLYGGNRNNKQVGLVFWDLDPAGSIPDMFLYVGADQG